MAPPDLDAVRGAFDATTPFTVGIEEEVLLVDPQSWLPAPVAADVVAAAGQADIVTELPACQVELRTRPRASVGDAVAELAAARRTLDGTCASAICPVAAAVHPLACGLMTAADTDRGRALVDEYGEVARRQLVGALQVHVALGDADRTLAVYNALRNHLPELAALSAAAPFHEGRDTGLASVRPLIAGQLPRQGVPPPIASWEQFVTDLEWGSTSRRVAEAGRWWWELRPHLRYGTLELRVPDVQPTIDAARGVASVAHALVVHLASRHDDGAPLTTAPTWRIEENRWSALRHGIHGELADLETGALLPTVARLHQLFDRIESHAADGLDGARRLAGRNSADELRSRGLDGAVPWLSEVFAP